MQLPSDLAEELKGKLSLTRLATVGLFQKLQPPDEDLEIIRELRLHRAVLDMALVDSFSVVPHVKKEVEEWLDLNNRDFKEACDRAGLSPALVYKTFQLMKELLVGDKAKFKTFGKRNNKNSNEE